MEATIKTTIIYRNNNYFIDIHLDFKYNDIFSVYVYICEVNQLPLSDWIKLYEGEPINMKFIGVDIPCLIDSDGINVKFFRYNYYYDHDDDMVTFTIKLDDMKPVIKKYIDYVKLIESGGIKKNSNYNPKLL